MYLSRKDMCSVNLDHKCYHFEIFFLTSCSLPLMKHTYTLSHLWANSFACFSLYILETDKVEYSEFASNMWSNCSRPFAGDNGFVFSPFKKKVSCWPFAGSACWSNSAPTYSQSGSARAAGRVTCSSCSSKSSFGFWSGSCYRHARYVHLPVN